MILRTTVLVVLLTCVNSQATTLPSYAQSFVRAFAKLEANTLEGPALKSITDELSYHYSRPITQFVANLVLQFSKAGSAQKMLEASLRNGAAPDVKRWSILLIVMNRYFDENQALLSRLTGLKSQDLARSRYQIILFYTSLVTSASFTAKQIPVAPVTVATLLILTAMDVGDGNRLRIASALADVHALRPQLVSAIQMLWTTAVRLDCSQPLSIASGSPVEKSADSGLLQRMISGRSSQPRSTLNLSRNNLALRQ